MNITPFTVYLVMQADSLIFLMGFIAIFFGVFCAVLWINNFVENGEDEEDFSTFIRRTKLKLLTGVVLFAAVGAALTPSTKTLAAALVIPAIAKSDAIQKDFPEIYNLAVGKLKEQLQPSK